MPGIATQSFVTAEQINSFMRDKAAWENCISSYNGHSGELLNSRINRSFSNCILFQILSSNGTTSFAGTIAIRSLILKISLDSLWKNAF